MRPAWQPTRARRASLRSDIFGAWLTSVRR